MNFKQLLFEEEELNTPEKLKIAIKNGRVPGVSPDDLNKIDAYLDGIVNRFKDFPSIYRNAAVKLAIKRKLKKRILIVDAYYAYFNNRNKQEAKTKYKQLFTDFENGKIGDKAFEDKIKKLFKDKAKGKEEANKLYEDDNYLVVIPKNFAASCKYGEGTKWCTTGSESMFKDYSEHSPLIIVINKKLDSRTNPLAKVQLHSKTNSAMDAKDEEVKLINYLDSLPNKIQEILKKYGFNKWNIILKKASEKGNIEKVKEALKNGAGVHVNNDFALSLASYNGHTEIVKLLLAAGANLHANNDFALRHASYNGYIEIIKILLAAGADIHANNDYALRSASYNGHMEAVKILLDAGADIHVDNDYALRWASFNGHTEVVKLLLDAGANVHANDDYALRIASKNNHTKVVKILKQYMKKK